MLGIIKKITDMGVFSQKLLSAKRTEFAEHIPLMTERQAQLPRTRVEVGRGMKGIGNRWYKMDASRLGVSCSVLFGLLLEIQPGFFWVLEDELLLSPTPNHDFLGDRSNFLISKIAFVGAFAACIVDVI